MEKKRSAKTSGEVQNELELVMMRVAVGDELPFAVFVLHHAVTVVHGVVADRDQAVHDEDDNEIEAEFLPETSTVPTTIKKTYGEPQRGRKESRLPRGPRVLRG